MDIKILITGPPKCGKSSLISKLIKYYNNKKNYNIYGFLTPEIRVGSKRIGFDIVDIHTRKIVQLARVGDFKTKYNIGKYNVFVEEFDNYIKNVLNIEGKSIDLMIIDEIGKMELLSKEFQNFITRIFASKMTIIATLGLKLKHQVKQHILNLPNVLLLKLNHDNFQLLFQRIISLIS